MNVDINIEGNKLAKVAIVIREAILSGITGFEDKRKLTGYGNTRTMSLYHIPTHGGGYFVFTYNGNGRKIEIQLEDPRRGKKLIKIFEKEI